jgi:hypothetical protein
MVEPSAEEEDYQEAGRSTGDYADYQKPQKPRNPIWGKLKPGRKLGIGLAILVLVAALAAGGYWFYKNRKSDNKPEQTAQTNQTSTEAAAGISGEIETFESTNFNLSFDYPADWTASEDSAEEISVLSPGLKLKGADGKDVTGQIYFRISAKGQPLQGFESGNAIAVLDSQKIAYANPTQAQRASTYISFLRYADNSQGLDAVYITGDLGYETDQDILKTDIEQVDPIVSIEFYLCPESGCEELSGVYGIGEQTWENENISVPLTNMLESLVIN